MMKTEVSIKTSTRVVQGLGIQVSRIRGCTGVRVCHSVSFLLFGRGGDLFCCLGGGSFFCLVGVCVLLAWAGWGAGIVLCCMGRNFFVLFRHPSHVPAQTAKHNTTPPKQQKNIPRRAPTRPSVHPANARTRLQEFSLVSDLYSGLQFPGEISGRSMSTFWCANAREKKHVIAHFARALHTREKKRRARKDTSRQSSALTRERFHA